MNSSHVALASIAHTVHARSVMEWVEIVRRVNPATAVKGEAITEGSSGRHRRGIAIDALTGKTLGEAKHWLSCLPDCLGHTEAQSLSRSPVKSQGG